MIQCKLGRTLDVTNEYYKFIRTISCRSSIVQFWSIRWNWYYFSSEQLEDLGYRSGSLLTGEVFIELEMSGSGSYIRKELTDSYQNLEFIATPLFETAVQIGLYQMVLLIELLQMVLTY